MRKLLLLLLLLPIGVFGQDPVKGLFGSGTPNPNLAGVINTIYTDISSNTVYICTNVTLTPTTRSCTWTPSSLSVGVIKANTISATDYGVVADTKWDTNATLTNGSGAVTLSATSPPAAVSDVGKVCFATSWQGGTGGYAANVLRISAGTVSSVTDATHLTCSTNSNSNCAALCSFIWGTDDTTALSNAWNAAANNSSNRCISLVLPSGGMLTSTGQFNTSTCNTRIVVPGDFPMLISGQGMRVTYIIPIGGTFSFNHSTSCNGAAGSGTSCFAGINGLSIRDLSISGFGWDNTAAPASTNIGLISTDGYWTNIDLEQFGASDANLCGYYLSSGGAIGQNINSNGGGSHSLCGGSANGALITNSYFCCGLFGAYAPVPNATAQFKLTGFQGFGCSDVVLNVTASGATLNLDNVFAQTTCNSGSVSIINVGATGRVNFNTSIAGIGGGGNENGVFLSASGAQMYANDVTFVGSGTGTPVTAVAGSKFYDRGGNTYTGGTAVSFAAGTFRKPAPEGNCGAVGSAASPSVAACGSDGAGSVSCSTSAVSTCTVNTTAVNANSQIMVQQRTDTGTGTRLSVTCNTTLSAIQPAITAIVAGTSFSFGLTQPVTNPNCYAYSVIN
jgi:hypothetical protein